MFIWKAYKTYYRSYTKPPVLPILLTLIGASLMMTGCRPQEKTHPGIELNWSIEPDPPTVGRATIHITLVDSTGQLMENADVQLEGNMSHPGMKPILARATETTSGHYSSTIEFTMGGDWFFLVKSTLPDDRVVERQIQVPGVQSN